MAEAGHIERSLPDAGVMPASHSRPAGGEQAGGWHLLAQIDNDNDADTSRSGKLYFMVRPGDLRARRFDQARYTYQHS